jgi:YD repeat-containing protein
MEEANLMKFSAFLILAVALVVEWSIGALANAGTLAFDYDSAGRLSQATFANTQAIAYSYDSAGNLLQRQINLGAPNPDSDGDGLDDAWEQLYFGNLLRDGSGDFDSDGSNDLNEFLAGTVPNDAGSVLKILSNPTASAGSVTVEWPAVAGKTYRLQFKNSLGDASWTDVPGDVTAAAAIVNKVDASASAASRRFYRVMLVP